MARMGTIEVKVPNEHSPLLEPSAGRSDPGLPGGPGGFGAPGWASLIMWRSGLRVGETMALEWRDIDLTAGTLLVRRGKGGRGRTVPEDNDLMTGSYVMVNPVVRFFDNATGTGNVLMSRLREGRANTARGAGHFLRETVGRVRYAGGTGQLTVRADSGLYTHAIVAVCRKMDVRYSITIRQHKSLRNLIEAIPETDWTPIPLYLDFGDGAERGRPAFPGSRQTVQ